MNTRKLNELFDKARSKQLDEDFQIGQAAQALKTLKNAVNNFKQFVDTEFTDIYKQIHNDPRDVENNVNQLTDTLNQQLDTVKRVVAEMETYLDDVGTYLNPESVSFDKQHEIRKKHRWARWEEQPVRSTINP
jgi:methyl-accepting chemotaxis protein